MKLKCLFLSLSSLLYSQAYAGNSTVLVVKNDLTAVRVNLTDEQIAELTLHSAQGQVFFLVLEDLMEVAFPPQKGTEYIGVQVATEALHFH
jgi:hypothetical protein